MKNPNLVTTLGEVTIIYPNYNNEVMGIETAICIKSYDDGLSIVQGDNSLYLPKETIDDFIKQLKSHKNLNHKS